ncbi:hypothetical protein [Kordiimonas sp. UBA4487]|mgnify:CR=1 FL=1|jgi:predicted RNA-binding Zn-ribbon protein involved in translation (DUF1610 family)|uniref:hypothetical protein n=1 Tax=Kordiimonas sp. UBA4487 TaxID=1946675 RepID=UPI00257F55F2|nr:hypothetical protein [Kordiimonas sp. UBA4487]
MASETNKNHWIRLGAVVCMLLAGGLILISLGYIFDLSDETQTYLIFGLLIVEASLFIWSLTLFRCPFCSKNLIIRTIVLFEKNIPYSNMFWAPKECPKCEKSLP